MISESNRNEAVHKGLTCAILSHFALGRADPWKQAEFIAMKDGINIFLSTSEHFVSTTVSSLVYSKPIYKRIHLT